jgi:hypothetical protein
MEITNPADCRPEDLASTLTPAVARGRHMASKSDLYRERAADFENKARLTSDPSAKIAYFELAHAYLQLAEHLERVSAKEREDKK